MESIFSRLEATNNELSSIDEAQLRSLAKRLDLQIEALDRERASLVFQRKRCRAVLSPLRRFPNELLAEIFSWAVTADLSFKIPTNLSQTCKRWREIVLNSPDLWTNLVLPLNAKKSFHEQEAAMLEVITTCVRRAQNRPMSLSVESKSGLKPPGRLMPQFLAMIQQATPSVKWKSIELSASISEELSPFFDRMALYPEKYAPITALHLSGYSRSGKIIPGGIDIRSLVNLRSLSLNISIFLGMFIDTTQVPWSQLTSLTMTTWLSSSRYMGILRECINLVTCSIEPYDTGLDEVDPPEKVRLPRLKHLKLQHTGEEVPSCILISLFAPSLEEFAFGIEDFPQDDVEDLAHKFAPFSGLIDKHSKSLRKLSIPGAFARWRHRNHLFDGLHHLKHLCITAPYIPPYHYMEDEEDGIYNDRAMMDLLVVDHSQTDLTMPLLEDLEFVEHAFLSVTAQDRLGDVIFSRCPGQGAVTGPRNLRRVVFRSGEAFERGRYRGMTGRMRALQENGVSVEEFETPESYVFLISPPSAQ